MEYPQHVSIIMDGNGRWARQQGKMRLFGHNAGVESVRACCEYAVEHGIKYLSLYAFSQENWDRPEEEVEGLMNLMAKCIVGERDLLLKNGIRFLVIGDRTRLGSDLLSAIDALSMDTASNSAVTLILMLSYSGRWDIVRAAGKFAQECLRTGAVPDIGESDFQRYLSTAGIPDPDLLIRTSGEQRISNYMLWQCAYTEFYYTPVLWPDFRKPDLDLAIKSFNGRQRRYGKVEQ